MNAAETIKSILSIEQVVERYGVNVDNRSRALCPFHSDKHPSASIKNGRFHCFVCDLHLDIFDFTGRLFDIDFKQSLLRLDTDFCLGLCSEKPDRTVIDKWKREQDAKNAKLALYRAEYNHNAERYRLLIYALRGTEKPKTDEQAIRRASWMAELERLGYWFRTHQWK